MTAFGIALLYLKPFFSSTLIEAMFGGKTLAVICSSDKTLNAMGHICLTASVPIPLFE